MPARKKILMMIGIVLLVCVASGFFNLDLVHAQGFGTGYLSGSQLPTDDVRVIAVRIINIALGAIGTVFLGFIIYAGFLWMTARGNTQQVDKARKIIINAVTGLIIIFMAFAITRFIFNILEGSQNGGGTPIACTDGTVSGCSRCLGGVWQYDPVLCPLPGSEFKVRDIATAHGGSDDSQDVYLCSAVQAVTNNTIDQSTVPGNVVLTAGGSPVAATLSLTSRAIELIPSSQLSPNTTYTARYNTAIADQSGLNLSACDPFGCSLNGSEYTWNFTTGTTVDQQVPTITSTNPISDTSSASYPDRNVDRDEVISVTFSEAIRSSTVDDGSGTPIAGNIIIEELQDQGVSYPTPRILDPALFEVIVRSNSFDLVLNAPNLFEPFGWYKVTVQNVEDLCGNVMVPVSWEFQTNDRAPGVGGFYPSGTNVCPDVGVVTVTFNTSMYYNAVDVVISNGISPISAAMNPSLLEPGPYQVTGSDGGTWSVDPASNFRVFTYQFNGSLNPGPYTVAVGTDRIIDNNGNFLEQNWNFTVGDAASCTCSPYISSINPSQGFLGQCVTITGQCFNGAAPNDPSDPRYASVSGLTFNLGGSQVPATIGSQGSNYVVTTIPNSFVANDRPLPQLTITYNDSILGSLSTNNTNIDYFVSSSQQAQGPCLLSVNPAQACTDSSVRLSGLRFGSDPGAGNRSSANNNVTYADGSVQVPDGQVASWSDTTIDTVVPAGTVDGNVQVRANGLDSNVVPFDLACGVGSSCSDINGMCSNAQCSAGLTCNTTTCLCEDNGTSGGGGPVVTAKDPTCSLSCTNVAIWAEFSENMQSGDMNDANIDVLPCGTDCTLANLGSEISYLSISYDMAAQRVTLDPSATLTQNNAYRVILHSDITSSAGVGLSGLNFDSDGDAINDSYSWTFATKASACVPTGVTISPLNATADQIGQSVNFRAYPEGSDTQCGNQAINGYLLEWIWASSDAGIASISSTDANGDGLTDPVQQATSIAEGVTNITATEESTSFSASAVLTVDNVTCDETTDCTNGGQCPGSVCDLSINRCTPIIDSLSPGSGPPGRWVTVQGCYFGSSQGSGFVRFGGAEANYPACGGGNWQDSQIIIEVPNTGDFSPNDVAVYPGNGLMSNIVQFDVTNECSGVSVPTTGVPGLCSVNPSSGAINASVRLAGVNFGDNTIPPADNVTFANAGGRTQALTQNWSDASIDATVPVDAVTGDVIVEVNSCPSNAVNYDVSIGPGSDCSRVSGMCTPSDSKCGSGTGLYCEPSSCTCQFAAAPTVATAIPSGTNVCRNAAIELTFNQLMDTASVRNSIELKGNLSGVLCNVQSYNDQLPSSIRTIAASVRRVVDSIRTFFFGQPTVAQSGCLIPSSVSTYNIDFDNNGVFENLTDRTVAVITPQNILEPGTSYWAEVSTTAKSRFGVNLASFYSQPSFTTGSDMCQIHHVSVIVTPPGAVRTYDNFYCAGQDTCADDQDGTAGNQHRWFAQAYDVENVPLVADYSWVESDSKDAFALSANNINDILITPSPIDGAQGTFTVTAEDESGVVSGRASRTLISSINICENPWPARPATPFIDSDTDFSLWYCRDRGVGKVCVDSGGNPTGVSCSSNANCSTGQTCQLDQSDDLPELSVVQSFSAADGDVQIAATAPLFKQFLFLLPAPSPDAIALRVYQNSEFLSPLEWYRQTVPNPGSPSQTSVDGYQAIRDGRTVYISAAQQGGSAYGANMYLLSYSNDADDDTKAIYDALLDNWSFTLNLVDLNACDGDLSISCTDNEVCEEEGAGTCAIPASRIRRDLKRITDLGEVRSQLMAYRGICSTDEDVGCQSDADCGGDLCIIQHPTFPRLSAGTFVTGQSTSRWPSWNGTFARILDVPSLPSDPFNSFNGCPAGYDQDTCWDDTNRVFECPAGSHIYQYVASADGSSFNLYANLELDTISWIGLGGGGGDSCTSFNIGP